MSLGNQRIAKDFTVVNPLGLHARPAALFVQAVSRYKEARVWVSKADETVDGKSIMSLLLLGVMPGETITVSVEGKEAAAVMAALEDLFEHNLELPAGAAVSH